MRPLGMTDHSGQLGPRGAWVLLPRGLGAAASGGRASPCCPAPPGLFRKWAESGAIRLGRRTRWKWLTPLKFVGQYGPRTGDFRWPWYAAQLAQAALLIGRTLSLTLALSLTLTLTLTLTPTLPLPLTLTLALALARPCCSSACPRASSRSH